MYRILFATVIAVMAFMATPAAADSVTLGNLVIENPWARASAGNVRTGAAYMTIRNTGSRDDRLIAADSEASEDTQLHTTIHDGNIMRMREVAEIAIPAGGSVTLKPGSYHVMLIGLNAPLVKGKTLSLTLTFELAGTANLTVPVLGVGARGPAGK